MIRTIPLDGSAWRMKGYLGRDAAARVAGRPGTNGPGWLPARVPGSVVDDLWRTGEVPDPYVGRNSLASEWVAARTWLYRRRFRTPAIRAGDRAWLRFEGVDHAARIFVDGEEIGRHAGMFVPFEVPLDPATTPAEHELTVLIEPAPASEPQAGRTSRVRVHKSRMTYGWDFCPRLVHQGIWKAVALLVRGPVRIADVRVDAPLAEDGSRATIALDVALDGPWPDGVRVEAQLTDGDRVVAEASGRSPLRLDLAHPRPWWPNGLGDPYLYRLQVRLNDDRRRMLDELDMPVGFRRLELAANEGGPAGAMPYTVVVNGRRVPIRGWNWTPQDVLYGVPRPDRLAHLIRLARQAHVNLLRVWGGGLIETEAFYDACDRAGILVWQEFSLSSSLTDSRPPDDTEFVDLMRREAEAIVPLRRNHPSLAIWCGGNELEGGDGPLDDGHPVLAAIHEVVDRQDPGRPWLPSSPSGPQFHNRLQVIASDPEGLHDVHGPWEHQGLAGQYELYDRGTALLNSEFGVEGMASLRQVEALVAPTDRWPATRENPVYRHLGDWWINEPLVQAAFGGRLDRLADLVRASRFLQAEGLRYAVEANRRRWPRNSGSIPWQFNESYPNAWCTSAVDHRGDPKPAYFGVARAYQPVHVCASFARAAWAGERVFRATAWAWSFPQAVKGAVVRSSVRLPDGTLAATSSVDVDLPASLPVATGEVALEPLPDGLFFLDQELYDGQRLLAANRYLLTGAAGFEPLLDLASAGVEVRRPADGGDTWLLQVAHRSGPAAAGVVIEDGRPIGTAGWAVPGESGFDLLPGECREIEVRWESAPRSRRRLRIDAWNLEPIHVG